MEINMAENFYERVNRVLTWKRVMTFNGIMFVLLIVPLSLRLAQQNTENRSGAAGEVGEVVVTPPPSYPANPPKIDRVTMFFGKKGDTVVLLGSNFGDYKWGSKVYVGNVEATNEFVVRWSNSVIEVKIPETARTGKVWVSINNQVANWEGSLLLYDVAKATQVGLKKISSTNAQLFVTNGSGTVRGMIELGYVSEPITITSIGGVVINSQTPGADALGKKIRVEFMLGSALSSAQTGLLDIVFPGIGSIELVRGELYDSANNLIPIYSDPLNVKVLP